MRMKIREEITSENLMEKVKNDIDLTQYQVFLDKKNNVNIKKGSRIFFMVIKRHKKGFTIIDINGKVPISTFILLMILLGFFIIPGLIMAIIVGSNTKKITNTISAIISKNYTVIR